MYSTSHTQTQTPWNTIKRPPAIHSFHKNYVHMYNSNHTRTYSKVGGQTSVELWRHVTTLVNTSDALSVTHSTNSSGANKDRRFGFYDKNYPRVPSFIWMNEFVECVTDNASLVSTSDVTWRQRWIDVWPPTLHKVINKSTITNLQS